MKWIGRRQSGNVEDQRGGGGGGRMPGGLPGKGGLIDIVIIVVIGLITGKIHLAFSNKPESVRINIP